MHAGLALQEAVGVVALDHDVRRLQAGLVAVEIVENFIGKAVCLGPAGIHAVEHGAPILRLRAARARVEGQQRVVRVIFARQQGLQTGLLHVGLELGIARRQLLEHGVVVFLQRHFADGHQVVPFAAHGLELVALALERLRAHDGLLRARGVVPEAGGLRHGVQALQLVEQALRHKGGAQLLELRLQVVQFALIFFKFDHDSILQFRNIIYSIAERSPPVKGNFLPVQRALISYSSSAKIRSSTSPPTCSHHGMVLPPFRLLTLRPPIVCVRKGKIARLLALPLDIFSKNR